MNLHAMSTVRSVLLLACLTAAGSAQQAPSAAERYDHQAVMISMRDGVRLNTEIFVPKNAAAPLPILFRRTPYGVGVQSIGATGANGSYKELADDGYIFVFQDLRG